MKAAWELAPALLFASALLLFVVGLSDPPRYMFDEVYHAYTAGQYVEWNTDAFVWNTKAPRPNVAYMWNHPPAGVWLIAAGIRLWGDTAFGWRFASALFGALGVVIAYLFSLRLSGRRGIALLAAALLMTDGLYFTQSRIGMLDIFLVVFLMCAFWSFYRYLRAPLQRCHVPLV